MVNGWILVGWLGSSSSDFYPITNSKGNEKFGFTKVAPKALALS